ncbi:ABC transporter ATP-binding protein [Paenibacillus apiarius]|uniref:ABC transporter ATP-binding protein n=1 Tax=Paenibacillus apiarius TaxID=46240 RepID=A0ABT4E0Q6_9BACL|nr:ABC transporter ATP-binding protein [Paenibacillus apiarius]MCY9523195.1 ABC transporter ATP-binding protein [Paenibacillus apiarius]MCY9553186.1 ABC transporter ATP-binding protein [Paenibacillus apiarius]MCY9559628.1 ABC transporter ATP-binding protein [Paenibacillus apiarius]MCY9686528.1 ABC transporter ATP-binding protein [Paenibacillus apiarius]
MISIRDVRKSYRMGSEEVTILRGINLEIRQGDFVAIIGPSGSGKSTLMNVIGCLDTPSSGNYTLDGMEVSGLSDNKLAEVRNRKIGFIFQSFHLLPKLSAVENVELPLIYRGLSNKERREAAIQALQQVGLDGRMGHRPSELSGGQQQRVAIARALAAHPPILLADEPTGALDTRTGKEVLALIEELNNAGHTIVLITHDLEVAARAKRVVFMNDGILTEERGDGREAVARVQNVMAQHSGQQA